MRSRFARRSTRGVDYLERHEDLDGNYGHWPDYRDYVGSTTGLARWHCSMPAFRQVMST